MHLQAEQAQMLHLLIQFLHLVAKLIAVMADIL